jgi:hyperosmotically inducible protein
MRLSVVALLVALVAPSASAAPEDPRLRRISREVFHELSTLPRYGVFDHLAYRVGEDFSVTLLGAVSSLGLKDDAERAVREIEGVETVRNEIEMLPASIGDDRLRRELFRAIYLNAGLERYAFRNQPPIRIIVRGGKVALEGMVAVEMDRALAVSQARQVNGVTSVVDHLQVEKKASNEPDPR